MLLTYLVRQYPSDRYDETTLQGIFRDIRGDVARSRQLSSTSLKNGDEPSFIFKAFHGGLPNGETDEKK
jgi:hypothetical protein